MPSEGKIYPVKPDGAGSEDPANFQWAQCQLSCPCASATNSPRHTATTPTAAPTEKDTKDGSKPTVSPTAASSVKWVVAEGPCRDVGGACKDSVSACQDGAKLPGWDSSLADTFAACTDKCAANKNCQAVSWKFPMCTPIAQFSGIDEAEDLALWQCASRYGICEKNAEWNDATGECIKQEACISEDDPRDKQSRCVWQAGQVPLNKQCASASNCASAYCAEGSDGSKLCQEKTEIVHDEASTGPWRCRLHADTRRWLVSRAILEGASVQCVARPGNSDYCQEHSTLDVCTAAAANATQATPDKLYSCSKEDVTQLGTWCNSLHQTLTVPGCWLLMPAGCANGQLVGSISHAKQSLTEEDCHEQPDIVMQQCENSWDARVAAVYGPGGKPKQSATSGCWLQRKECSRQPDSIGTIKLSSRVARDER